ncbi:MAG: EF-hand domain-containing protein [Verrucomicrobia bacterium]|nr:EF-hand domain-containing protein [Verrucomicrobiota bacterium]
MKRTTSTLLATALLFGVATIKVDAQTRKPFGTGELPELLKPYDLNNDGKLSVEERQAYEKALRDARPHRPGITNPWDTNGDGVLSDDEKQAARDAIAAKMLEERTRRFDELDVDKDGLLTATELQKIPHLDPARIADMIAHLDTDGDGMISKAEFLAAMTPVEPPLPGFPLPQPLPALTIPAPPLLAAFDTNNDRQLSEAEVAAMLTALDKDSDGTVAVAEWNAYLLAHPELLPLPPFPLFQPFPTRAIPAPQMLMAFDTNKDRWLSTAELALMKTALDTDSNGTIAVAEWNAYLLAHPELLPLPPFPLHQPIIFGIPTPPLLALFDTNNDRLLSSAELALLITALDADTDGTVSAAEWKTYLLAHPELLPPPPPGPGPH